MSEKECDLSIEKLKKCYKELNKDTRETKIDEAAHINNLLKKIHGPMIDELEEFLMRKYKKV